MSISSICTTTHCTLAHHTKALIQLIESSALSQWRLSISYSTSTLEWCTLDGKAVAQRPSDRLGSSIAALLLIVLATFALWRPTHAQDISQTIAHVDSPSIIGGTIADQDAWPWMVALVRPETEDSFWAQFCAGTLIAPDWVLTAAHCTLQSNKPVSPERIQVLLTSGSLGSDTNQRIGLRQIIQYPNYARVRGDSDLALLQLERPVERAAINLVAHDDNAAELTGRTATVLGWGRTEDVFRSNALMQVDVPLVMPTTCIDAYAALGYIITDNMLCAGYSVGGKDACTGDSGGPLMVSQVDGNGQQSWKIIGIVSWGKDCAKPNAYGVYTRLSQFTTWIQVQTGIDRTVPQTAQPFPTSTVPVPGLSQNRFHFFVPISILTP